MMKKVLLLLILIFALTGCSSKNVIEGDSYTFKIESPWEEVEDAEELQIAIYSEDKNERTLEITMLDIDISEGTDKKELYEIYSEELQDGQVITKNLTIDEVPFYWAEVVEPLDRDGFEENEKLDLAIVMGDKKAYIFYIKAKNPRIFEENLDLIYLGLSGLKLKV